MISQAKRIAKRILGRTQPSKVEFPADEFISWLRFANAGMLRDGNIVGVEHAVKNMPFGGAVVEIGSFCGLSTNLIAHTMRTHGRVFPFFTADRWEFEGADTHPTLGASPVTHAEYRTFVRESFIRNVRLFAQPILPHSIEVFSDEFFAMWYACAACVDVFGNSASLGGPISFAYIDGNHAYDFAKRDFVNTDRYLLKGGYILFDDSGDGSGWEVCRVIEEIKQAGQYEVILNNPNYLVRKR